MFWKKKNDDVITIELDIDDRRNGVRIQPLDKILIQLKTQSYELLDISFMGLSFAITDAGIFKESEQLDISLTLPLRPVGSRVAENTTFTSQIDIIRISSQACHCQFSSLTQQQQSLLDQFILNEQKRQILVQNKVPS